MPQRLTVPQALNRVIEDRVVDLKLTGIPTLAALAAKNRIRQYRKNEITWDVDFNNETAVWESLDANGANTAEAELIDNASLKFGNYRVKHQFDIKKTDIQEALAVEPEDLKDLLGDKVDRAIMAIMQKINKTIYVGDGTAAHGQVVGLGRAYAFGQPYAGIDPTVAGKSAWNPIVIQLDDANPDLDTYRDAMLYLDYQNVQNGTGYDTVITTPDVALDYVREFDQKAGVLALETAGAGKGFKNADLGWGGKTFNGQMMIEDKDCLADQILTMNTSDIDLYYYVLPQGSVGSQDLGGHAVNTSYPVPIHISELPSMNSAKRIFEFWSIVQLRVRNRRSLQTIKRDITP